MGQPLFQMVIQEKKRSPMVLSSISTRTVLNAPVLSAQAEPHRQAEVPICAGTDMSAHHRYNHCVFSGGRKEL